MPTCKKCGTWTIWDICHCNRIGPAPKEERMPSNTVSNDPIAPGSELRKIELRAIYGRAYFAALGGATGNTETTSKNDVRNAREIALETVRQWPAMQAELGALIGVMKTCETCQWCLVNYEDHAICRLATFSLQGTSSAWTGYIKRNAKACPSHVPDVTAAITELENSNGPE